MKRLAPGQRRFIAKSFPRGRKTLWGVYDVAMGSWPGQRPGVGQIAQDMPDEATAQAEADRVENAGQAPLSVA